MLPISIVERASEHLSLLLSQFAVSISCGTAGNEWPKAAEHVHIVINDAVAIACADDRDSSGPSDRCTAQRLHALPATYASLMDNG